MKIRIIFATIALFALVSAFKTKIIDDPNYKYLNQDPTRYQVDPTPVTPGTGAGQFTCETPTNPICVIVTTSEPTQDANGKWWVPKATSTVTYGTFTLH